MDIANTVATYLANANFGVVGTSIFVGQIPDNTNGLWVERAAGSLNNYVPIESAMVNIYVKNTKADTAVLLIENIKRYIHRMHNTTVGNAYVYSFLVLGDVEEVQRDPEYAKIYKISIEVKFRYTQLIS